MADSPSKTDAVPIAMLRSLLGAGGIESPGIEAAPDPVQQKLTDRYNRILQKLEEEATKTSANVLITVQDRDASLLQSCLADDSGAGSPLPAGGIEAQFGEGVTGSDI